MVLTIHIDRWDVSKILVDNGSQTKILFLSTFEKWATTRSSSKTDEAPLWLQRQKNRVHLSNNITGLIWHHKKSTHRIHNLRCCRHALSLQCHFDRGLLNIFEAALHSAFLCLKVPGTFGVITVFGSQKEARNIERGFAPGHKNVHFFREDADQL
jgi:hypothetical protein